MRLRPRLVVAALSFVLLLVPMSAALAQSPDAPEGEVLRNAQFVKKLLGSRARRLHVSAGPDPDTVYVGKSYTNHTGPGNYWNLYTGTYLPGLNVSTNALWDWDNSVGIQAPDSLHGWWVFREQYNATGGLTLTDDQRPWWALDHGNTGNYVIAQQSSAKRTYGVVSYWHADPGNSAGLAMMWSPISGTKSAWCGLREHGDASVVDQVTKNPFNQDVVQFLHRGNVVGNGSPQRFPGYVDQADQMMYRDIAMTPSQTLTVSFSYRTRMSTSIATAAATRTGWFHGDPLAVTSGNFISSSAAGANATQDSFMVYVGAPVNDGACAYSDGVTRQVYDKQRRWFSEVIKVFGAGASYFEIFATAGNNPADTLSATPSSGPILVPAATISSVLGGVAGNVRLVFRCKTNRFFADSDTRSNGYNSAGRGAVLLDDVTVSVNGGASPAGYGTFEAAEQSGVNAIDNRFPLPPGLTVNDVWRSTGKPVSPYIHAEALANLTYNDLCGGPNSPGRNCNIGGVVLTVGNHDDGENSGDSRFTAFREIMQSMISPTINLLDGPGGAVNSQGMRQSIARATDDVYIWYDMYAGMFNLSYSGNTWTFGNQAYPARMPNGGLCWGQPTFSSIIVFNPEPQCFTDFEPMAGNGLPILTSNASGIPDSLRMFLNHQQQCFRFAISLGCNSNEGGYFDNVSVAFVDLPGVPGQASAGSAVALGTVSTDIWQLIQDTFPANETAGLPGTAAFDTTTGFIKTGLNTAQATGNSLRFDIPGDSTSVLAASATVGTADDPALKNVRVDLVFRILPGPGNYQVAAGRSMVPGGRAVNGVLLQLPTNQAAAAVAGDASFWGQYMADPGLVSRGTHTGPGGWDPLTWNSCRMDTLELNIFPVGGSVPTGTALTPGRYQTTIHESDPKFATLGIDKFRCFVIDTTKAATSTATLNNVSCNGVVPAWLTTVPKSRTGWDSFATTKEFTKVIPDGLLTPGSHVQYFFRKSHSADPNLEYAMTPDTNVITPQNREGPNTDQHRWQQFAVLPDRWKNNAFGGAGMACMLYVDLNDRRGNEGRFVSVMDSLGNTAQAKWGAHNGWHAAGTTDITSAGGFDARTDATGTVVANKNSQPGTTWDMYQVKASESLTTSAGQLGSRLANRSNMGFAAGKEARSGPTPEMLRAYYRIVMILSGDLNSGVLGPFVNRSQNDIGLLTDYLTAAGGVPQPRGLFIQGDGFGQSEQATGGIDPQHVTFLTDKLGVVFRSPTYQGLSENLNDCADVLLTTAISTQADIYGVVNFCTFSNDVLNRNAALSEVQEGGFYENVGSNGPYVSDVVKTAVPLRNWIAVTSGYEIEHLLSRYCETDNGRLAYYYYMMNKVFGGICQITGTPNLTLDAPGSGHGREVLDFMKVGNAVMRQGTTSVRLGIAHAGRLQIHIYDIAGRKVRTLADRVFPAGEQVLQWDGTDDTGGKVGRGVYFVRSSTQKDAGRIIVLNR
jgi:hypothetical protein